MNSIVPLAAPLIPLGIAVLAKVIPMIWKKERPVAPSINVNVTINGTGHTVNLPPIVLMTTEDQRTGLP